MNKVVACVVGCVALLRACAAAGIDFAAVRELAAKRAAEPYRAPDERLPPRLAALSYDDSRKIAFRDDRTLWRADGLPFQVQFYPRGGLFRSEVIVHEATREGTRRVAYDPANFQVNGIADLPALPANLGYAGFKVLFPLSRRDSAEEVISFLGSSYFRAIGAGQEFGLSARGLALDSAIEGRAEEFPRFAEFWLLKPDAHAKTLTLFALLDSPSVAGAYEFVVAPGKTTTIDTRAALFFRDTQRLVGLAPLTSMFWYGENMGKPPDEKRPEVHDSDGLFVAGKTGQPLWLPLQSPGALAATELPIQELKRFGLAQRDRRLESYNDPLVHYERRPTACVEPRGAWGPGKVRLAELPPTNEYVDNVVAYWVPDRKPERGKPFEVAYRLSWGAEEPEENAFARVIATREVAREDRRVRYAIEFSDARAKRRDATKIEVDTVAGKGTRVVSAHVQANPDNRGWRVEIEVERDASDEPSDVQCRLHVAREVISEMWRYRVAR